MGSPDSLGQTGATAAPSPTAAQQTGTIEGRVLRPATGSYLERVRVTVDGTGLETFTDSGGYYRLANVPVGNVKVTAFFTGLRPESQEVAVTAGQATRHNIQLHAQDRAGSGSGGVVTLGEFVVSDSKEMEGAAIAINEQRFAPNSRLVVAVDEFGPVSDENVGEVLKLLPGVQPVYSEGSIRSISINGVPSGNVPVTADGFDVASSQGTSRVTDLNFVSLANLSRIEVVYSPTPESPGAALAGSVNMVSRTAFERSKPLFKGSVSLLARDNALDFDKTDGPGAEPERKVSPNVEFTYVRPVNDRFGFSIAGITATNYLPNQRVQTGWRGARLATNGAAFPHTTADAPYLSNFTYRDLQAPTIRRSLGLTADYKLSDYSRLSFTLKWVYFWSDSRAVIYNFLPNRVLPGDFSATHTHGAAGAGEITHQVSGQLRTAHSYMPTLTYRYNGPVWNLESGLAYSSSDSRFTDISDGRFLTVQARRTGVTVLFDDITPQGPRTITVRDAATGVLVDPFNLDNYALSTMTMRGLRNDGMMGEKVLDIKRTAYANARRAFNWRVPFAIKTGVDVRQSVRDFQRGRATLDFVGPDGVASTRPAAGDDGAAMWHPDPRISDRGDRFGFPSMEIINSDRFADFYKTNPQYFRENKNTTYRDEVNNSKYAEEVVSSAYIRGDLHLMEERLKLIGGLRAEQTNIKAQGPLTDPTRNQLRDASGQVIRDRSGRPVPITTDPLEVSRLTFITRGAKAEKEYLRLFPSINASYNFSDKLVGRAAYYWSVGRPDFNQYAGGITLPDLALAPSPNNRIRVNNVGIKAWSARSTRVSLEYYFQGVGVVSVAAFRREFENFFGQTVIPASPGFLALYGLDEATFGDYEVETQYNLPDTVRMQGVDLNYKQSLTFLPHWARGLQVFGNMSFLRTLGPAAADFAGFIPRTASWGVSLSRERFNVRVNWNYRSKVRG